MMKDKSLSIRIDPILLKKLHYVAGAEARSCNSEILYLIRKEVANFEAKHGKIDLSEIGD